MAPVRDAMAAPAPLRVEIAAGSPFELLIGMYATGTPSEERDGSWAPRLEHCPPATRDRIDGARRASRRDLASPARACARAAGRRRHHVRRERRCGQAARAAPASAGGIRSGLDRDDRRRRPRAGGARRQESGEALARARALLRRPRPGIARRALAVDARGDEAARPGCPHGLCRRGLSSGGRPSTAGAAGGRRRKARPGRKPFPAAS